MLICPHKTISKVFLNSCLKITCSEKEAKIHTWTLIYSCKAKSKISLKLWLNKASKKLGFKKFSDQLSRAKVSLKIDLECTKLDYLLL